MSLFATIRLPTFPTRIVMSRLIFAVASVTLFHVNDIFALIGVLIAAESAFIRCAPLLPRRQYPSFFGVLALLLLVISRAPLLEWSRAGTIVIWTVLTAMFIAWGIYSDVKLFRASTYHARNS